VVYAKKPFAGPQAVLAYLSRYTHRVAISNSRLISCDQRGVTFKHKDYRLKGRQRHKTMTLKTHEFIHRFLRHVLPSRFHRIRHYGLLLLAMPTIPSQPARAADDEPAEAPSPAYPCPACGGAMVITERFEAGAQPRAPPPAKAEAA
jgi:hypothetical protein